MLCLIAHPTKTSKVDELTVLKEPTKNNYVPEEGNAAGLDSGVDTAKDVGNNIGLDEILEDNDFNDVCANACDEDKGELDPEDFGAELPGRPRILKVF